MLVLPIWYDRLNLMEFGTGSDIKIEVNCGRRYRFHQFHIIIKSNHGGCYLGLLWVCYHQQGNTCP